MEQVLIWLDRCRWNWGHQTVAYKEYVKKYERGIALLGKEILFGRILDGCKLIPQGGLEPEWHAVGSKL